MRLAACVAIFGEASELHDDGCLQLRPEREAGHDASALQPDAVADEPLADPEPAL